MVFLIGFVLYAAVGLGTSFVLTAKDTCEAWQRYPGDSVYAESERRAWIAWDQEERFWKSLAWPLFFPLMILKMIFNFMESSAIKAGKACALNKKGKCNLK